MKTFHFIYGFVSAVTLMAVIFCNYADWFLDDYYIEKLHHEWYNLWNSINLTINILFAACSIIWVYLQGLNAKKELLKQEKNEQIHTGT